MHLPVAARIQFHCRTEGVLGTTDAPVRACELPSLLQRRPVARVSPPPRLGKEADLQDTCGFVGSLQVWLPFPGAVGAALCRFST